MEGEHRTGKAAEGSKKSDSDSKRSSGGSGSGTKCSKDRSHRGGHGHSMDPSSCVHQRLDSKTQMFDCLFHLRSAFLRNSIMHCPITHMTSDLKLGKKKIFRQLNCEVI